MNVDAHIFRPLLVCSVTALLVFAAKETRADVPVPHLSRLVTDLTDTLTADQVTALEHKLLAYEKRKGSQIAVLILPSTKPEDIEQFSIRVVDQWKLGRKGVDDGVLFLVAKEDRRMRFEIGYALEGVLPDSKAKRIIDYQVLPNFKNGDFYEGIDAGVDSIIALIQGEPLPEPAKTKAKSVASGSRFPIVLIVGVVIGLIVRAIFNRFFGALAGGLAAFILGLIFLSVLMEAGIAAGIAGFTVLVIGLGGIGGWSSSGSSSSGGGSWGGGGGGSFGGGGASGSW